MAFRKIDPRIWNDEKFSTLSDRGKLVFFFVLTHPNMTPLGAMRATAEGLSAELHWNLKDFRKAFGEALALGILEHDAEACFLAAPNFLKYNRPESPNVVKAWVRSMDLLPECALKAHMCQRVKGFIEALKVDFREALPEGFIEAFTKGPARARVGEQEPKPEHKPKPEQSTDSAPSALVAADGDRWPSPGALAVLYNAKKPPECPEVTVPVSDGRRKTYAKYLRQFPDQGFWEKAFVELAASDFLRGKNPSPGHEGYRASLDWLCQRGKDGAENVLKAAEGRYRNGVQACGRDDSRNISAKFENIPKGVTKL